MKLFLPVVYTDHLMLRPIQLSDAIDMFEYASNPEVLKFVTFPRHTSVQHTMQVIEQLFLTRPDKGVPQAYAIVLKSIGKMIGTVDIHTVKRYETVEIGYILNPMYWGKGYMTEAVKKMLEVTFDYIGVRRIEVQHDVENYASQRVIEKCGFVREGHLRKAIPSYRGDYADTYLYSLLFSDYQRLNQRK